MGVGRKRGIAGAILIGGLLIGQLPWPHGAAGATPFTSQRYGYTLVVPDGWDVTRGDCAASQQFTAQDQASMIQVSVAPGAPGAAAIRHAEQRSLARFGAVDGHHAAFSTARIGGRSFQMLQATVHTAGGLDVMGRAAATTAGGMRYLFTGAAYPFNADHGLGVLHRIAAAFLSIRVSGRQGVDPACGTGAKTPVAGAPAAPTPRQSSGQGGQGGPFMVTVTISPNPVPRSVGHATATVQTLPHISCTANLTYDVIRNPLGALFGVTPQMTDGDGRTSWTWSLDFGVQGGTITVTCTDHGVSESGSAHFSVG